MALILPLISPVGLELAFKIRMTLRVCSDIGGIVDADDEDADGDKVSSATCGSRAHWVPIELFWSMPLELGSRPNSDESTDDSAGDSPTAGFPSSGKAA